MRNVKRTQHFYESCAVLGAVPFVVAGAFDLWGLDTRPIIAFAAGYDRIITHNALGEYGHPAHIKLHHAMKSLGLPMQVFGYGIAPGAKVENYERKLQAIRCYEDELLLPWIGKKFNLAYEGLVDCIRWPFKRRALRSAG